VTRWIAAPFTPDGNFTLSSLDIAIGNLGGTPGAIVMLVNSTSAGAPGTALEQWTLSNLPNTAQAAITSLASQLVPTLKAGQTYWVVAQGSADDSMDFWQASDVGLTGGMDNVSQDGWHTFSAPAPAFDVRGNPANDGAELLTVSATGDGYWLAQESIAVAYGENLAPSIAVAITQPLPITLGGVTVTVKDSAGVARPAGLYYVSPGEIVYVVPAGTAAGPAGVTVGQSSGAAFIAPVAPRLFSANGNGQGVAAASAVRVSSSGEQDPVPVFHCQSVGCTSMPLDLGATTDTLEVQLYGTGIRGVSALSKVVAQIGGVSTPVTLAGPQGQLEGLDQVNVEVPRSLAGAGEVPIVLIVDGIAANVVTVNIK
jgi:uncharacterized protein (TIGR03437 family)